MNRYRQQDTRAVAPTVYYQNYDRPSCPQGLVWSNYHSFNPGMALSSGTLKGMWDVTGNAPNPKLGPPGFKTNPMTKIEMSIDAGTGTDWLLASTVPACSGQPNQYFSQYRRQSSTTPGRQYSGFRFQVDPVYGRPQSPIPLPVVELNRLIAEVTTDLLSTRGRGGGDSNLYESLAEFNKTLAMVPEILARANSIMWNVFRTNKRALSQDASALYLMTRYGFAPTVSDLFNVINALDASLGQVLETTRKRRLMGSQSSASGVYTDVGSVNINGLTLSSLDISIRAWSVDQYERTLKDALGLSWKNLATVSWDLLPMSFVYDWLGNIGSYLGAIVPDFGVKTLSAGYSVRAQYKEEYSVASFTLVSPSTRAVITPPTGTNTRTTDLYWRVPSLPSPELVFRSDFKFSGLTRTLDAMSLLNQRLAVFRALPSVRTNKTRVGRVRRPEDFYNL